MKIYNIKLIAFSVLISFSSLSCTNDFDNYNQEYLGGPENFNADFTQIVNPLKLMQRNQQSPTNWIYQLQTNLNADMYSGLFSTATPYNGGRNNTTYFMMDGWNERIMMTQLEDVFDKSKTINTVIHQNYSGINFTATLALAKILKVISASKVSDAHGPIIYSKFETPNSNGITDLIHNRRLIIILLQISLLLFQICKRRQV